MYFIFTSWHETFHKRHSLCYSGFQHGSVVVLTYHSTDAAPTDGGLELTVQFLDCTGCVEALSQQDDPVQEEKRSNPIDDVLHQLDSVDVQCQKHSEEKSSNVTLRDPLKIAGKVLPRPKPKPPHLG